MATFISKAMGGAARNADERAAFDEFPEPIGDDADFVLHLLRAYDTDFRWCTITANTDEALAGHRGAYHNQRPLRLAGLEGRFASAAPRRSGIDARGRRCLTAVRNRHLETRLEEVIE